MAAKVVTTVQKRLPIAGIEYSSVSASCTVEAEISDLATVPAQARALYAQAEAAVDEQLRLAPQGSGATPSAPSSSHGSPNPAPTPATSRPLTAQSYRGQRRQPSPISPAQARYLGQLGERAPASLSEALAQHGVASIDALTARAASQIIDLLLQAAA